MMLPKEILWEIAKKSPSTFFAMTTAIPWLGRESLRTHVQAQMKAHFTVKRKYVENTTNEYDDLITISGTEWILPNNWRHSNYDKPAEILKNHKCTIWYKNGQIHRDGDEPAIIVSDGTCYWCINGKYYRDGDEPAIIESDGTRHWCINGKHHRDGDKPAIIWPDGQIRWFQNNEIHRDNDMPAMIRSDGSQEWRQHSIRHRDDGPAVIYADGTQAFWKNGVQYTPE